MKRTRWISVAVLPMAGLAFLSMAFGLSGAPFVQSRYFDLTLDGEAAEDWFGVSVSGGFDVDGDGVNDIVTGAFNGFIDGARGKAYAYSGRTRQLIHKWDGETPDDFFGANVAHAGDVDGDGYGDIVVGAREYPDGHSYGKIYVYSGKTGLELWSMQGIGFDLLGYNIASIDDLDGDGRRDIVLGRFSHTDSTGYRSGMVLAVRGFDGQPVWSVQDPIPSVIRAIADAGDVNGDGTHDILVGGQHNETGRGHVHILSGTDGTVLRTYYAPPPWDLDDGDFFGWAVANVGDVDGDAIPDALVGDLFFGSGAGAAYLYSGATGAEIWRKRAESGTYDYYGAVVAGLGDVDGDGVNDFGVGSQYGGVFLYSGLTRRLLHRIEGGAYFGTSISAAGNVTGAPHSDFIIGHPGFNGSAGYQSGRVHIMGRR